MIKKLWSYIGNYKLLIILSPLCVMLDVVCELSMPFLMGKLVDKGIPALNLQYIIQVGILMIGLALVAMLFGSINHKLAAEVSQGFAANLRQALFDQVQSFSFSNIDTFSTASLVTRLTNDVTQLQNTLLMSMRLLTRAPLMLICALVFAIAINAKLAIILFIAIPVLVAGIWLIVGQAERFFKAVQAKIDAVNGTVEENLIGIRVVKAFVREPHEKTKFKKSSDELSDTAIRAGNLVVTIMPIMLLVLNGATIAVIWFGGHMVGNHQLGTGELVGFISYVMLILMSVLMVSTILMMLARARASAERIIEVLDTTPDIADKQSDVAPRAVADLPVNAEAPSEKLAIQHGAIEFRHVDFKYTATGKGENVLTDINLTIQPGEFVALVGGTGSGKSTMVSLIPRLYDVSDGQVLVDGVDVRDYKLATLRSSIGVVLQNNVLFSGTIRENLMWGNAAATQKEIEEAAQNAQAHDFIMSFPNGYDTDLGQGGVNVSGGQKQRLCIARALLKKPHILILDDSTSAVDSATEAKIRASFRKNLKDTTILTIAQRISSVQEADKIIVLDDGRVVGIGTHAELLANNPAYQAICASQMEGVVVNG
ncbi:ABC transporter ATP-binding protein [Candidatus Cryosericum hinesii]|uniref:ABC transporter ATP-binding protein n=1 Tax=Candidatus Cryosericum hinesii TaxID=2290915 RepID=A0A398DIQ8_9BACT|nr:ABC transporter ATP-binding protein [Candidatus Cryosericum hinesii]RIE08103.1 ABC transporter ATP-binding protein [Candidatus Cryosericum hinesii]RIE11497.1 ABC transporter ATP-binding protein [Candidatus Cryosericum hinesii]RIE12097.1 ABC transporter ATP-binding protein [Candidatus Cryosericum hinesii]